MSPQEQKNQRWHISRQINLSLFVQLIFLAALIVGSWVNLQKQLTILQHDIDLLLDAQRGFQKQLARLDNTSVCYEYRLRAIEKHLPQGDISREETN